MTEKIIAYCGLVCSDCPAFIAHKTDDNDIREKTAKMWSEFYNADITTDMINCTGCHGSGVLFRHCDECNIRQCCHEKHLDNCSGCPDFICNSKLKPLLDAVPAAKELLEELRNKNK
ncbi:MAG: DUF3795 domain-containing protein [bacterium]